MKVFLAGAYGHLGSDILEVLVRAGHEVVAADLAHRSLPSGIMPSEFVTFDALHPRALEGHMNGVDVVISTVGLTSASSEVTNYDIDFRGNENILDEAKRAGVKHFVFVSVHGANPHKDDIPIVQAKGLFEQSLRESGISYTIIRPTGYFYDIIKVFKPMIEKGKVTLLKTNDGEPVSANVIDTPDLAQFIVEHMNDNDVTLDVGGKETYSYEDIARMCFEAAGKQTVIKYAPQFLFDMLTFFADITKNGRESVIRFSKWTLTHDMTSDIQYGTRSFKEYIRSNFAMAHTDESLSQQRAEA
ncbi:DUF6175 family protein [Alloscardovia venturai]|uniref:DUF6175 family protein n=1 Tax=Alloscardovia venturai TaxID=1769421 RepID=A0ABW2Y7L2_9BIFI